MLLALLLACTQSSPPPALDLLLADLEQGARALAEGGDPLAERFVALGPTREAIRQAEREMLRDAIDEALGDGDHARAAQVLTAAMAASPDDEGLAALARDIESSALSEDAGTRLEVFTALADASPDRGAHFLTLARHAALETRYSAETLPLTRAMQEGITPGAAEHLLRKVDAEYYAQPDWSAASAAAEERVGWLASAGVISEVDLPPAHDVDGAVAALSAAGASEAVIYEWVGGALASLDPWTRAVWPAEIASWQAEHAGVYYGVGLDLEEGLQGEVLVARPLPDTTAWTSGIHQGDRVVAIDTAPVTSLDQAEDALLGEVGTVVLVEVEGRGIFDLVREPIEVETVTGYLRGADNAWDVWLDREAGLAYVRVERFRPTTEAAFDALTRVDGVRGMLLDLRGNPGGDINGAVQIADRFVADGVLASISGRVLPETGPEVDTATGAELPDWNEAIAGHHLEGVAVVVLVDAETASAAEVLAGSLQERAGARVVGAGTWGKGFAQALRIEQEQGYAVQFTNLVWTLPSGRRLARQLDGGVVVDARVELGAAEGFQVRRLASQRGALRVHADGTPMTWTDPGRREGLPLLDEDPAILAGELVLRAMLEER